MCRVVEGTPTSENVTNIADITEYLDDNKEETTDRDSQSDNVNFQMMKTYQDIKMMKQENTYQDNKMMMTLKK